MSSPAPPTPSPLPRYGTPRRTGRPTRGPLLAKVAGLLGWSMFPWQDHAGAVAMEYHPDTRLPAYRTVGIGVARQNGKTLLVLIRIVLQLLVPGSTVVYTAQDRNVARFKWQQHVNLLCGIPAFAALVQHVSKVNGSEMLIMRNGSVYLIVTPTAEKAGRSLTVDLAIIDEAFAQEDLGLVGAVSPAMIARPYAQLWILSNAGHARSALWRHYTDLGRAQVDNPLATLCWLEWAAADDAERLDEVAWIDANPSLGLPGGVTRAGLESAVLELDGESFEREHLNRWADSDLIAGIDALTWAACRDDDALIGEKVCLAVDFTPNRDHGCLAAAGADGDRTPVEIIEHSSDLDRVVARTAEVAERWQATVIVDRGPAGNIVPALVRRGVKVHTLSIPDVVRACGDFHDAAVHARLAHRGDHRLTDAVAAATKRKVGDGWVWQRRAGADITALMAVTLARWGIVTVPTLEEPHIW